MACRPVLRDMLVFFSLSLFLYPTAEGANITVELGQTATLPCTGVTNLFKEWQRLGADGTQTQLLTLYTGGSSPDLQLQPGLDTFNLRGRFTATADAAFTATITNTQASDDGMYQCDGTSSGGNIIHTLVTHKLNSVLIQPSGTVEGYVGGTFDVTCDADSKPAASFNWTKQGDSSFTATGATLRISSLTMNDTGTYVCTAYHAYASDTASVQLTVSEGPNDGSAPQTAGPNVGGIVGGVIGALAGIGVMAAVVFFVVRKKRADRGEKDGVESGNDEVTYHAAGHPGAPENMSRPPPNQPEVMYAELDLKNAPAGSRKPYVATPDDSPTEYAQIRPSKPPRSTVPHTLAPDDKTEYASIAKPKPSKRLDLQAV